jgi:uncharacterized protein
MRAAFAAIAAFAGLCGVATAGPTMPFGPSPERGLAGIWRFIEAKPAPWAKLRSLSKTEAPFLEFAIDFADGAVKGPQPLSCSEAKYSSGVTYLSEIFGGRLAGATGVAMAKQARLRVDGGGLTTFHVACGAVLRDFYMDESANLVMADGDVLYTLERPTGMDPQQYVAGFNGPSFDCLNAKTTADRLICVDAALSKSDRELAAAYAKLKAKESAESFATVQKAQRGWLDLTIKNCVGDAPMPATLGDRNTIVDCLREDYDDRVAELTDLTVEKAGALVLEPRMRFRWRAKPIVEESDAYPWMSGGAQAPAFNAFIAKIYALDRWRMDEKGALPTNDGDSDIKYHMRRSYSVARFDARVVSLQIATDDYVGGNHAARSQIAQTWDMAKQRPVALDDVFVKNGGWKATVLAYCKRDLHKQFAEREAPDLTEEEIAKTIGSSASWLWGADKATVTFYVDLIGGMPGGEFDVEIPLSTLSPFMVEAAAVR